MVKTQQPSYTEEDIKVQILQSVDSEEVKVTEVKVSKIEFIQQCGGQNNAFDWWHEIIANFGTDNIMLTADQLLRIVASKRILVGTEYPNFNGLEKPIDDGVTKVKIIPVGQIRHRYYSNYKGRPACMGQEYRDSSGELHPSAVVSVGKDG